MVKVEERLEQLENRRLNLINRYGQLQEALQQTLKEINQVDGAIAVLRELSANGDSGEDEQQQP
jgi:chromosome segregation ATPase